eukprot:12886934-Prorocentrum_lima.AAC.1
MQKEGQMKEWDTRGWKDWGTSEHMEGLEDHQDLPDLISQEGGLSSIPDTVIQYVMVYPTFTTSRARRINTI